MFSHPQGVDFPRLLSKVDGTSNENCSPKTVSTVSRVIWKNPQNLRSRYSKYLLWIRSGIWWMCSFFLNKKNYQTVATVFLPPKKTSDDQLWSSRLTPASALSLIMATWGDVWWCRGTWRYIFTYISCICCPWACFRVPPYNLGMF